MSSSTDIHTNGNGNANYDHILRPRAVKPANPDVLRALNDDGYLTAKDGMENGGSTAHTR